MPANTDVEVDRSCSMFSAMTRAEAARARRAVSATPGHGRQRLEPRGRARPGGRDRPAGTRPRAVAPSRSSRVQRADLHVGRDAHGSRPRAPATAHLAHRPRALEHLDARRRRRAPRPAPRRACATARALRRQRHRAGPRWSTTRFSSGSAGRPVIASVRERCPSRRRTGTDAHRLDGDHARQRAAARGARRDETRLDEARPSRPAAGPARTASRSAASITSMKHEADEQDGDRRRRCRPPTRSARSGWRSRLRSTMRVACVEPPLHAGARRGSCGSGPAARAASPRPAGRAPRGAPPKSAPSAAPRPAPTSDARTATPAESR